MTSRITPGMSSPAFKVERHRDGRTWISVSLDGAATVEGFVVTEDPLDMEARIRAKIVGQLQAVAANLDTPRPRKPDGRGGFCNDFEWAQMVAEGNYP